MTLLRIDASILGPLSASKELADLVLAECAAARPDEKVVTRHLGADPLPADAWANASTPTPPPRTSGRRAVAAQRLGPGSSPTSWCRPTPPSSRCRSTTRVSPRT